MSYLVYHDRMKDFYKGLSFHLEMMAAAYLKTTNIPIEDCELVVETLPNKMIYSFRKRQTPIELINCPKCHNKGLMSAYLPMCTDCANKERNV